MAFAGRVREYHEIAAKSILRRSTVVDPWFLGRFGSNLYRGCAHACVYCDGRAERYYVTGDFARDIQVKCNALALARDELARMREPGFLFILVESELDLLMRSRQLHEIPHLEPAVFADVAACYAQACAG
jgi:hypothetical protein